jgi:cytochrome c-type biogenesis protein CcmH/NrfF
MLWFGPFLLLIGALFFLVRMVRRQQSGSAAPVLDADQRRKAQSLLKDTELPS